MTTHKPVRVRLAPSPTGTPHLGTMRQAVFDWLFARHTGGTFVLRIEDTDQTRYVPTALGEIYESLRWLGLDWDEGPDIGGPYAPYFQSQRLELYQAAAKRLIDAGNAYECYCTPARLDAMRTEQQRLKQPPGYDGRCRSEAGRAEAKAEAAEGASPVVRFWMPDEGVTRFRDYLRGEVVFQNELIDDFVILKSDGFPTYHLAMPVDDHAMEITHVIRGDEWLPSAPRHKLLFDALGYEMPVVVHTPLILGKDRSKLSKRHGAQSVLEYRDAGYLPAAVLNFLALLGWSLDDKTEIISRDELVRHFSLDRLIASPAVFDSEKLQWMNGEYMRAMPVEELARLLIEWLEKPESEGGLPGSVARPLDLEYTQRIVPLVRERVKLLPEARDMMAFFYVESVAPDEATLLGKPFRDDKAGAALLLAAAVDEAEGIDSWQPELLESTYRTLAEGAGVKAGDLFMLMRGAITGRTVSPPLFDTMEIVGRERCLARLRDAIRRLSA